MESLSRPPHKRKHSRRPYDGVFLSNGAERGTLEAHEYAEIFSGSSSIPVLDLSCLDERSGDSRSSELDYSHIFGGFRNDDVALPYEELFGSSAKKTQLRKPADQIEASDQSADESKKQFNVSFNKTHHQRSTNASNGKTHIAQLQAVPSFTHFVNETPQIPKTDVSRTWSFSAKSDAFTGKGEISSEKHHVPDIKPQPSASDFVLKQDASEKDDGEFSFPSPFYVEDFEENSVAAASAAALKRAIDQAQESIRLAKMIMDRKKEGYHNGSKARQRGLRKVLDREGEMDRDSKMNNSMEKYAELNPTTFGIGIDGKYSPSLVHNGALNSAAKVEVESVCKNAAEGKGRGMVLSGDDDLIPSNDTQRESVYIDEKIELKETEENVEAHSGGADTSVLSTNECKSKTANLEQKNLSVDREQGPKVVAEHVEKACDTSSQRIQELERNRNVEEAGVCNATFDNAGPGNKVESVLITPQRTRRQWKVLGGAGEYFGISQKDGVFEEGENDVDDKGKNTLGQVEIESESERKENGYIWETHYDEANLWFESEEQLKEALEKEIELPEIEVGEERVDEAHEPEIYKQKENHAHDGDKQILPEEIQQNDVEERDMSTTSECEVPETIEVGDINCAPVQNSTAFYNSEKNHKNRQYEENDYEEHTNEPVFVNSSSSSAILSEIQAACNVDIGNNSEDYRIVVENQKENYTMPEGEVIETFSETKKDEEAEHMFHQEDGNGIGSKIHDVAQEFTSQIDLPCVHSSDIRTSGSDPEEVRLVSEEVSGSDEGSVPTSSHENINGFSAHDSEECEENANEVTPNNEELKDELDLVPKERKLAEGKIMESEGAGVGERDPNAENNKENLAGISPTEEKDAKIGDPHSPDKNDYQQRIDAIKRGREREKDRKVVERAIREARERAFNEARERAERASVEKASAEAQQRALAKAQEKASRVKLRAERAAVDRATAEARGRALEKALSLKATHIEGRTTEKVSESSGSNGLKHSFSSSDLGNEIESAQRRKARLERHQRIMDRAAKALAEKNMRDILAQKEQAERNRLAEYLDADIKRWATGKEKNLRALLSTLQYILGPDSGWQAIPLTDIITSVAVKKAYRKATLCVHPDKLQQRGATIKQKYICEKVFDLLKAAWNRFNSDER